MNSTTFFALPASADRETNETAIRLGSWLFVPAPGLVVEPGRIQRHSPVRRGGSPTPVLGELYRTGGEAIYYSETKRCVLTVQQFRKLLQRHPKTVKEDWRIMQRTMTAYGRGTVRHPDNRTITLHDWHRILMNTDSQASAMQNVVVPR